MTPPRALRDKGALAAPHQLQQEDHSSADRLTLGLPQAHVASPGRPTQDSGALPPPHISAASWVLSAASRAVNPQALLQPGEHLLAAKPAEHFLHARAEHCGGLARYASGGVPVPVARVYGGGWHTSRELLGREVAGQSLKLALQLREVLLPHEAEALRPAQLRLWASTWDSSELTRSLMRLLSASSSSERSFSLLKVCACSRVMFSREVSAALLFSAIAESLWFSARRSSSALRENSDGLTETPIVDSPQGWGRRPPASGSRRRRGRWVDTKRSHAAAADLVEPILLGRAILRALAGIRLQATQIELEARRDEVNRNNAFSSSAAFWDIVAATLVSRDLVNRAPGKLQGQIDPAVPRVGAAWFPCASSLGALGIILPVFFSRTTIPGKSQRAAWGCVSNSNLVCFTLAVFSKWKGQLFRQTRWKGRLSGSYNGFAQR
eukprot:CAMPEP_0177626158 /NCGR_PEP_ID=MMETSP0419_2-20121207/30501_1 /TAXON_ID=582737 /ORGANISM="Tetraselmis sp., Strain GSL018" /LENGTH=437 /DNA_ID=CAMNT_0019127187 /DNA_START=101 /DNA_END=1417 /DNA_ORIENTATION=-